VPYSESIKTIIEVNNFLFVFRSNGRATIQVCDKFNQSSEKICFLNNSQNTIESVSISESA